MAETGNMLFDVSFDIEIVNYILEDLYIINGDINEDGILNILDIIKNIFH